MLPVSVSKSTDRFTDSTAKVFVDFETFVALQEDIYGVVLPRPHLIDLEQLKKFCTGLIEKDFSHLWREPCSTLSAQRRFGLAHSLFLFRKLIPKKKPHVIDYVNMLGQAQDPPDADFLDFARRLTRKIFPFGWDRTYQDRCLTSSLPLTACAELGRKDGGCRGRMFSDKYTRAEFCEYVMKSVAPYSRGVSRVQAIETGGKWRTISIPPLVDNCLRPLHKAMYSHLSHFDWLLRGDAKPARFRDFTPVEGEVFISGDYESATDNLNADLQVAILDELLCRSYTVPTGVREHAMSIYRSALVCDGLDSPVIQRRGQLMGQLTSFPLLCLINYITFRYAIRRPVPCRINGDDIVFRATPDEFSRWERCVEKGGLKLSRGKTLVHSRAFTLNSTPFWSTNKGGRLVGFVRSSALFPSGKHSERVISLNGRFYSSSAGFGRLGTSAVRKTFLLLNRDAVFLSRRSVTRGLGLVVDRDMLVSTGMWQRELFYLEQVVERDLPCLDASIPDGWTQVSSSWFSLRETILDWERRWSDACVSHAWVHLPSKEDLSEDTLISRIRLGCSPYGLGTLIGPKVRRMLRMSRSQAWKWVNLRDKSHLFGRQRWTKGKRVWVELDLLASRSQIAFIAASGQMA